MTELISIVVPTYNSEKTIRRAINSVLNQKFKNWELLLIDSFSKDRTIEIINSIKSKKIKIFYINKKKGLAKARYLGIKKSKGNIIAFLDSDDEWNKNKLSSHYKFYKFKSAKFTCSEYNLIDKKKIKKKIKHNLKKFNFNYLLSNRPIALSTVMIEKKLALDEFKKFLNNNYAEDYLWWLATLRRIEYCHFFQKNLSNIYLEGENRSLSIFKNYISLYKIYKNNFNLGNFNILKIFVLLILRTFKKNLFKFKSFFF